MNSTFYIVWLQDIFLVTVL